MTSSTIAVDLETRDLLELALEVARKYHVTLDELLGRGHGYSESAARRELWARVYEQVPSFSGLGRIFDRNHTTIISAVRKYWAIRSEDGRSAPQVERADETEGAHRDAASRASPKRQGPGALGREGALS